MKTKIVILKTLSWLLFIIFCIVCIYDIVTIDRGHFDRMRMINFRAFEGVLFLVNIVLLGIQINFEKIKEITVIISLWIIIFLSFIGSLVWETQNTDEINFQNPNRLMEMVHIGSFCLFIFLKVYISFKKIKFKTILKNV